MLWTHPHSSSRSRLVQVYPRGQLLLAGATGDAVQYFLICVHLLRESARVCVYVCVCVLIYLYMCMFARKYVYSCVTSNEERN